MEFTPMFDEKNVDTKDLFPEGEYSFKVKWAKSAVSKSQNQMIKLVVQVIDNSGQISVVDYLLEAMAFKLKHFCEATGLEQAYSQGNLSPQMCVGKTGRCKLTIQHDDTGKYPDKNIVEDYCIDEEVAF